MLADYQRIPVPKDGKFLTAQVQDEKVCLWYECESSNKLENRTIVIVGTGRTVPEFSKYIATVQHGRFVWHLFENTA